MLKNRCEKLSKMCPKGMKMDPKIDEKVMKIGLRNDIEKIMQKSVNIYASR